MAWNWDRDYKGDAAAGYGAQTPQSADAGMEDFLASARKLTDRYLETSRRQAEQILREARAQGERIVADARLQAEQLMRDAEKHAEEINVHAKREADEVLALAQEEAERIREEARHVPGGSIDQEYAVRCVSDCFDELRRIQEEALDLINAQWQKILIDLMPCDDTLPTPEPADAGETENASAPTPQPEPVGEEESEAPQETVPADLEARVSALSREMDELFRNRKS